MRYRPNSNSAAWTDEDIAVARLRTAHYATNLEAAIMLNNPMRDDEKDARDFREYQSIGHCRCLQCAS